MSIDIFPPLVPVYIDPVLLPDRALWNTQVSLGLLCGKNKNPLRERHRDVVCNMLIIVGLESDRRSVPKPAPPYHPSAYQPIA